MTFTSGKAFFLFFILLLSNSLYSASLEFSYDNNTINIRLNFSEEFSVQEYKKNGKIFSIKLKTKEPLDNITKEFWGYSIERVYVADDKIYKFINFEFVDDAYDAELKRTGNTLYVTFKFKTVPANIDRPIDGLYLRAFIGLLIILIFIFIVFWLVKLVYKGKVVSVIPGVGRVLGKIDISVGKSLYFYELGTCIYIFAITSNNMNLVDKITDPESVNIVKEGFAKRKDFSSYLRFFSKKTLNDDINITKTILEEKIDSLRKK
jgi:flagellar biogenesis protein FliO